MNSYDTDELTPPYDTDEDMNFLPPLEPPPPGTIRYIDIHVYDQTAEEEEEAPITVESTPEILEPLPPETGSQSEPPLQGTAPRRSHRGMSRLHLVVALVSLVIITTLIVIVIIALFTPTAIITIIPVSTSLSITTTIPLTTGATSTSGQLASRTLPAITMSQAQTVRTTGNAHQDAQAAHGLVIFYNAAPYAQTVGAGMLLTGADGTQIVTDQDATIPAGNLATNGQVTVSAHATIPGPAGNIQAGDTYGQCCRVNVFINNAPFSGGQPARDYHTVSKQDITSAVTGITASLEQSVQAALQTQVQPGETLLTPLPCTQVVTPDHAAGSEAMQDHVTVTETCTGTTYPTQVYQRITNAILAQQAQYQLGAGYTLTGLSQSTITKVTTTHGTLLLHVRLAGTYAYQFTQEQQTHLKAIIAGRTKAQATATLLNIPGVQTVSITTKNGDTLPTDPTHLSVIFMVMGQ